MEFQFQWHVQIGTFSIFNSCLITGFTSYEALLYTKVVGMKIHIIGRFRGELTSHRQIL